MSLAQPSRFLRTARRVCRASHRTYRTLSTSSISSSSTKVNSTVTTIAFAPSRSSLPKRSFGEQPVVNSVTTPVVPPFEKTDQQGVYPPRIVVFASNAATLTGDNRFQSIADVFENTWQRSFPEAYKQSKSTAEIQKGEPILSADEQILEDVKALGLSEHFQKTIEVATKPDGTTKVIGKARAEFEKKVAEMVPDPERKAQITKYTRSQLNKTFGTNNEPAFIKDFEFKTNVQVKENNNKFYKKEFGVTATSKIPWYFGGRIDGFHDGRLIEVKNRVNKVFPEVRAYENVQFQIYLQLLGLEQGDLLQRVKSDEANMQELTTTIVRDDALFKEVIVPRVQIFCDFVDYFLSNPRFGVEYLLLARQGQEKFLNDYLKVSTRSNYTPRLPYDADIVAR